MSVKSTKPAETAGKVRNAPSRRLNYGPLDNQVSYHIRRAQVQFFQGFAAAVDNPDVTPGRFGVLSLIAANPGLSQAELGAGLGIDRSTIVGLVDHLEGRGFVVRKPAPHDRRTYALELTDAGRAFQKKLQARIERHEREITGALSEGEVATLLDLLRRLTGNGVGRG